MSDKEKKVLLYVFLALFSLIVLASLASVLGLVEAKPEFAKLATGILIGSGGLVVAVIAVFRRAFLHEHFVQINIEFNGARPNEVRLDASKCSYAMAIGSDKKTGALQVMRGRAGWTCRLPEVTPEAVASFELCEIGGRKWIVQSFSPTTIDVSAEVP